MTKNDSIQLEITGLSSDGSGIGRHQGMAVFVPFTAPGDVAEVRIVKVMKSYAFGILTRLIASAPARQEADCEAFGKCGGCALRHIDYAAELKAKRGFVQDAFTKLGGFDLEAVACLPSPEEDRYRNKVQYPLVADDDGTVHYGFFASRSHRVIPCTDCKLQPSELNQIADALCAMFTEYGVTVYDETSCKGVLRHLYLRRGAHSGEVMVCIVINANGLRQETELVSRLTAQFPAIKTILINSNRDNT
ncbi:MAG: class I SAM-dependent RNA methyltransferase, partial [Pygmaiobacter massiliensis]